MYLGITPFVNEQFPSTHTHFEIVFNIFFTANKMYGLLTAEKHA